MILVTGGMGFIGLHTARSLLDAGEGVVITYHSTWREPSFIKDEYGSRAHVEQVDITDYAAVLEVVNKHKIDGIVHLAVPGLGALRPAQDLQVNTQGLFSVLSAGHEANVRRITIASSLNVYWSLPHGPWEEQLFLPIHSGSATEAFKKTSEILSLHYGDRSGVQVVCARISGFFGPLYHATAVTPSLANRMCQAAVRGTPVDYSSDGSGFKEYGKGTTPFEDDGIDICYVKDGARAIQMLQMAETLEHQIYNIGGGKTTTNLELARAVLAKVPEANIPLRPGKGPRWKQDAYMDISRIKEELGFQHEYSLEEGVADYIDWLQDNPQ